MTCGWELPCAEATFWRKGLQLELWELEEKENRDMRGEPKERNPPEEGNSKPFPITSGISQKEMLQILTVGNLGAFSEVSRYDEGEVGVIVHRDHCKFP